MTVKGMLMSLESRLDTRVLGFNFLGTTQKHR